MDIDTSTPGPKRTACGREKEKNGRVAYEVSGADTSRVTPRELHLGAEAAIEEALGGPEVRS